MLSCHGNCSLAKQNCKLLLRSEIISRGKYFDQGGAFKEHFICNCSGLTGCSRDGVLWYCSRLVTFLLWPGTAGSGLLRAVSSTGCRVADQIRPRQHDKTTVSRRLVGK